MSKYILSIVIILSSILLSFTQIQTSSATATYQGERQSCNSLKGGQYAKCVNSWTKTSTSNPVTFDFDFEPQKKPLNKTPIITPNQNCEIINGQKLCGNSIPDCVIYRTGCTTNNNQLSPKTNPNKKQTNSPKSSNTYKVTDQRLKTYVRGNTLIYGTNQFVQCTFQKQSSKCTYYDKNSIVSYPAKISGNAIYINKNDDYEKIYLNNFKPNKSMAINQKYNKKDYLIPVLPESLPINFFDQK